MSAGCRKPPPQPAPTPPAPTPRGEQDQPKAAAPRPGVVLFETGAKLSWWDPATGGSGVLRDKASAIQEVAISPDGQALLFFDDSQDLWLLDLATDVYAQIAEFEEGTGWLYALDWTKDSRRFAFTAHGNLHVGSRAEPEGSRKLVGNEECTTMAWSPDGTEIAFGRRDVNYKGQGLFVVSVADGRVRRLTEGTRDVFAANAPAWSPDGRWIAFEHSWEGGVISLVRPDGSEYREGLHDGINARWLGDGSGVVFSAAGDGHADGVWWYRVAEGSAERLGGENRWATCEVQPGGQLVAILVDEDDGPDRLLCHDVAGEQRELATLDCPRTDGPFWSRDGRQIAVAAYGPDPEIPAAPATTAAIRAFDIDGGQRATGDAVCERLLGWIDAAVVKTEDEDGGQIGAE